MRKEEAGKRSKTEEKEEHEKNIRCEGVQDVSVTMLFGATRCWRHSSFVPLPQYHGEAVTVDTVQVEVRFHVP